MNGKSIGVLIADDGESIRTLLARLIQEQPDMAVVGQASNGKQAVALPCTLHIIYKRRKFIVVFSYVAN